MNFLAARYILVIFLFIVAYAYSLEFAPWSKQCTKEWCGKMNNIHESCLVGCNEYTKPLTTFRGQSYIIGGDPEKNNRMKNCLITFWGFTHYMLFAIVGFIAPELFWEMFLLGCGFELFEHAKFDCHDALDIGLNTAGFLTGQYVRMCVDERTNELSG